MLELPTSDSGVSFTGDLSPFPPGEGGAHTLRRHAEDDLCWQVVDMKLDR